MNVNRIKLLNTQVNRDITIPLSENLDMSNRGDSVSVEEEKIVDGIIGKPTNYELCRYSMQPLNGSNDTKLTYNYNFQIAGQNKWGISYSALTGVEDTSLLNDIKGFKKSFFKMDFFDKKDRTNQKMYFSIIINTTSGVKGYENEKEVLIPKFELDHVGTQEGYYIYWYEDKSILNISEMYFKTRFFNAINGQFYSFLNRQLTSGVAQENDFYYKLTFDYNDKFYKIYNISNTQINTVSWYQNIIF